MRIFKERFSALLLLGTLLASLSATSATTISSISAQADTASQDSTRRVSKTSLEKTFRKNLDEVKKQQNSTFNKAVQAQLSAKGLNGKVPADKLNQQKVTFIVELDRKAASKSSSLPTGSAASINAIDKASDKVISSQKSIQQQVEDLTGSQVKRSFGYLLDGFSIQAKVGQLNAIRKIKGVKSVTAANVFYPADAAADRIAKVQNVWEQHHMKGQGTVIAIIDSGIDPSHKDLTLDNNSDEKISHSAANDAIQKIGYGKWQTDKVPFAYNYADGTSNTVLDTGASEMHGMHVAGIAAANGKADASTGNDESKYVVGVAPDAQLLDMKVFSNGGGGATSDDLISAIEDSVKLGADVLNMSLGSVAGSQSPDDPEQEAVNQAAAQGVIPAISAGNNGLSTSADATNSNIISSGNDEGSIGAPGVAADAITVASSENNSMITPAIAIAGQHGSLFSRPALTQTSQNADISVLNGKQLYLAKNGSNGLPGIGDPADFDGNAVGKVAVVMRGGLAFTAKEANAMAAGAAGVIIIDNNTSDTTLAFRITETTPTFGLLNTDGLTLLNYAKANPDDHYTFSAQNVSVDNPNRGKMSTFTSYGPLPDLNFKPDITAPGGEIWSTANNNGYQSMNGTSMASPFIAGSSALVVESLQHSVAKTDLARFVKNDLMNTALPFFDQDHPDSIVSPRQQGAGLVQVDSAVNNKVFASDASGDAAIALKQIRSSSQNMTVTLNNTSKKSATYKFNDYGGVWTGSNRADATAYDEKLASSSIKIVSAQDAAGKDQLHADQSITVAAGSKVQVHFDLQLPSQATQSFVEGYLGFMAQRESADNDQDVQNLAIPYMGYYGNWDSQKIFDSPVGSADSVFNTSYFQDLDNDQPLGLNHDGSMVDPQLVAISPDGDGIADTATPIFNLLRNGNHVQAKIFRNDPDKTPDAKAVRTLYIDPSVTKSYYNTSSAAFTSYSNSAIAWDGSLWNPKSGQDEPAADGQYYYQISASPDGNPNAVQTQTLPIKVDDTAPVIMLGSDALSKDADGHFHLKADLTDNLSGIAATQTAIVAVNGVTAIYPISTDESYVTKQSVDIQLNNSQAQALTAGKNQIQMGTTDNAGNFGEGDSQLQAPGQTTFGLVLYNLSEGQVITTNSAIYHQRYNTVTLMGSYPEDFYVNGHLVQIDKSTQTFDMEDGRNGIPLPKDGTFIFSSDADGKNVIRTIHTRLAVTEPVMTLDHAGQQLTSDDTTIHVTGTVDDFSNLDNIVVGNITTGNVVDVTQLLVPQADNKASFAYDLPLQFGTNSIVAQSSDKDGNVNNVQRYTVNSMADARFAADPSTVAVFDNGLAYGSNIVSAASSYYDRATQMLTISGHLRHAVDKNGLMIGETTGSNPTRQVVAVKPDDLTFTTQIKAAPNTKISVPVQIKYQGQTIVDNSLRFYIDTSLPDLNIFSDQSLSADADGTYNLFTNKSPYHLKGEADDNYDGYTLVVNGDVVDNEPFSFVYGHGPNGKKSGFDVPFDLSDGNNVAEIDLIDALGNQVSRKLNVHYYSAELAAPTFSLSTDKPTNKTVQVSAKTADKAESAPADENLSIQYSQDDGKTWLPYDQAVNVQTNGQLLFRTVDQYGNQSKNVVAKIDNIYPSIAAQVVVTQQLDPNKKQVTLSAVYDKQMSESAQAITAIQYSEDGGKTWQDYSAALVISKASDILFRSYDQAGNVGHNVAVQLPLGENTVIKVKDVTIDTAGKWQPSDSFVDAKDIFGNSIAFKDIHVEGKVNTRVAGSYKVVYSYKGTSAQSTVTVKNKIVHHDTRPNGSTTHDGTAGTPSKPENHTGISTSSGQESTSKNVHDAFPATAALIDTWTTIFAAVTMFTAGLAFYAAKKIKR